MGEVEDNVVRWCAAHRQPEQPARAPRPRRDHARKRKRQADGSAFAPRKPAARAPRVCARATPRDTRVALLSKRRCSLLIGLPTPVMYVALFPSILLAG